MCIEPITIQQRDVIVVSGKDTLTEGMRHPYVTTHDMPSKYGVPPVLVYCCYARLAAQ